MSDKASDFKRLAVSRVNKTLHDVKLIGNLASSNYESTPEQREAIFRALRASIDEAESRFNGRSTDDRFTL